MSDFDRFISYKSKFQLLKHEIAEKILQAETQSAALEESLRINQRAKEKRKRGGSGGGGSGGGESNLAPEEDEMAPEEEGVEPEMTPAAPRRETPPPSTTTTTTPMNEGALADMLAACESASGYSDL